MQDALDTLLYHGRRLTDELVGASLAENAEVALLHTQLSLLHLDRFVAIVTSAAEAVTADRASIAPRPAPREVG